MCLSRNKNSDIYPCKPQFYCIKVGFKGAGVVGGGGGGTISYVCAKIRNLSFIYC